ncbi:MAG: hypothetical protein RIS35_113 [Pseudomonadota bacterium]
MTRPMRRLQSELQRLYLPHPPREAAHPVTSASDAPDAPEGRPGAAGSPDDLPDLVGRDATTRSLVLGVDRRAGAQALERVWRGVQVELDLPAPAVAIDGVDGYQLWCSLASPVTVPEAQAFLDALRQRFVPELPPDRLRPMPALMPTGRTVHAAPVPAEVRPGQWSAFVKPELAVLFGDTPWLDLAPNPDGQADLLAGQASIPPAAFAEAARRLGILPAVAPMVEDRSTGGPMPAADRPPDTSPAVPGEPEAFLLRVMRDDTAPLALRVEAAKALLAQAGSINRSVARR